MSSDSAELAYPTVYLARSFVKGVWTAIGAGFFPIPRSLRFCLRIELLYSLLLIIQSILQLRPLLLPLR